MPQESNEFHDRNMKSCLISQSVKNYSIFTIQFWICSFSFSFDTCWFLHNEIGSCCTPFIFFIQVIISICFYLVLRWPSLFFHCLSDLLHNPCSIYSHSAAICICKVPYSHITFNDNFNSKWQWNSLFCSHQPNSTMGNSDRQPTSIGFTSNSSIPFKDSFAWVV